MFDYQKKFLRALASQDKHTVFYFPRAMGKTYVRNFIKEVGKKATQPSTKTRKNKT